MIVVFGILVSLEVLVELETDNQEVARILCTDFDALADNTLVDSLHGLLSRQWLICIHHISREINRVVDGLVIMSRDVPISVLEFPSVLSIWSIWLVEKLCRAKGLPMISLLTEK
ncbi:hypothetical protein V6N11_076939 [Hibiscus sabdariffa]|uniref:RNase H type-1 domain-containing protein n=1 Tax=Hibiscus sabdariffa TaxID=183260 RepID=A0ABR2TCE4_9ROSI